MDIICAAVIGGMVAHGMPCGNDGSRWEVNFVSNIIEIPV